MADDTKKVTQQGFYARPATDGAQECPQCFYTPSAEAIEQDKAEQAAEAEDCPQCFYTPEAVEADKAQQEQQAEDCPQCFYTPSGETKE